MKKLLSIVLVLCTCLSLCAVLSSCGEKTPYEEYFKSHGAKDFKVLKTEGESKTDEVTDYYELKGDLRIPSNGVYSFKATEITREAGTVDSENKVVLHLVYDFRDDILKVYVEEYTHREVAVVKGNLSYYEWVDGYKFVSDTTDNDAKLPLTKFEFDINKYFENGKLTADDANAELELDASYIVEDSKGLVLFNYTERNADWEEKALADILDTVNAMLAEIDACIEK